MQAALLREIGKPLCVEDVPEPALGPDEVLVRTHTCGICRTDLHVQDGLAYTAPLPHIPGHEPAGVVVKVGDRVDHVQPGQRVAPHLFLTCANCRYCRTGHDAQCLNVGGIIGVTRPGAFAEFFKAPARNLLPLPDAVPFETAGLVSCAVVTAVHAYRQARLGIGDSAVVLGAGGIGLILVQLLKAANVRVAVLTRSSRSLKVAQDTGADAAFLLDDPAAVNDILSFAGGNGVDCIFECVGTAATMKTAGQLVCRRGQIIVIGEEPEFPQIDTIQIAQREIQIIGSRNGSKQDASDALMLMAGGIIAPRISARFPLAQINQAMDVVRRGGTQGRVVITMPS